MNLLKPIGLQMPLWPRLSGGLVLLLLLCSPLQAQEYGERELEVRLADARAQLDEAARQLAELNLAKHNKTLKKSRKAMLGIVIDDEGEDGGIVLHGLTPGGGAAEAGLKTGDRLVAVNGVALGKKGATPLANLTRTMAKVSPEETVPVRYEREGKIYSADIMTRGHAQDLKAMLKELEHRFDVDIDLDGLEEGLAAAVEGVAIGAAALASMDGMTFDQAKVIRLNEPKPRLVAVDKALGSYFGVERGLLVVNAPQDAGDVRNGDILLALNGKAMTDVAVAHALLAEAGDATVAAKLRRQGRERSAQVNAAAFGQTERVVKTIRIENEGDDMEIIVEGDD